MQWSEVRSAPSQKTLRQFAGLWLLIFGGLAAWRMWHGEIDTRSELTAVAAVVVGVIGLARPTSVRWIYTAWMVVAFPIGWTVSKIVLGVAFYLVFTPVAAIFRLMGRDALRLRRAKSTHPTYWLAKTGVGNVEDYFRQF